MARRFMRLTKQEAWGTPLATGAYFDLISESIRGDQGVIYPELSSTRERRFALAGPWTESGDISLFADPNNLCEFLKWGVDPNPTPTNDGTRFKNVFEPEQDINYFTVELNNGHTTYSRQVYDCVVSSILIEAAARELVSATIGIVAGREKLITPSTSDPGIGVDPPFVFHQGAVSGLISANVEAFRVTHENIFADDAFTLGSRFLPDLSLRVGSRNVTGELDIAFLDWSTYQKFYGADSATEPQSELTDQALTLNLTGPSAGGVGDYAYYRLLIELPHIILDTSEASFDRRERVVQSVAFTALKVSTDPIIRYTIVNKRSSF